MAIARDDFYSWYEFECFLGDCILNDGDISERVTVLHVNDWIRSDMTTNCKSWKTALKRFFSVLREHCFYGWYESIRESCENGVFSADDMTLANGKKNPGFSWCYGVEQLDDDIWYIFLNIKP